MPRYGVVGREEKEGSGGEAIGRNLEVPRRLGSWPREESPPTN